MWEGSSRSHNLSTRYSNGYLPHFAAVIFGPGYGDIPNESNSLEQGPTPGRPVTPVGPTPAGPTPAGFYTAQHFSGDVVDSKTTPASSAAPRTTATVDSLARTNTRETSHSSRSYSSRTNTSSVYGATFPG
ncbi:hypothetical protein Bbelb_269710 [Branchiostoma belcheri]|nr:hypothetical protein Bbelb_269710 [Branchiostoma belcheri]